MCVRVPVYTVNICMNAASTMSVLLSLHNRWWLASSFIPLFVVYLRLESWFFHDRTEEARERNGCQMDAIYEYLQWRIEKSSHSVNWLYHIQHSLQHINMNAATFKQWLKSHLLRKLVGEKLLEMKFWPEIKCVSSNRMPFIIGSKKKSVVDRVSIWVWQNCNQLWQTLEAISIPNAARAPFLHFQLPVKLQYLLLYLKRISSLPPSLCVSFPIKWIPFPFHLYCVQRNRYFHSGRMSHVVDL